MEKLHISSIIFAAMLFALSIAMNAQEGTIYQPSTIEKYYTGSSVNNNATYEFEYNERGLLTNLSCVYSENQQSSYSIDLTYNDYNLPSEKTITYLYPSTYSSIRYCFYYDPDNNNRITSIKGYGTTPQGSTYLCFSLINHYDGEKIISQEHDSDTYTITYPSDNKVLITKGDQKGLYTYNTNSASYTLYEKSGDDYYEQYVAAYTYKDGKLFTIHNSEISYPYYFLDLHDRQKFTFDGDNLVTIRGDVSVTDDTLYYDDNRADFIYDDLNRLQSITCVDYNYNAVGEKELPNIDTVFYDPNVKFVDELMTSGAVNRHKITLEPHPHYFDVFDSLSVTSYVETPIPHYGVGDILHEGAEWYYEITDDDGNVTYQYLVSSGDTTIGKERPHIIVKTNTLYDRLTQVTHEYLYSENDTIYWWSKELGKFTILYDFNAEAGDSWVIETGNGNVTVNVDAVENYVYNGVTYKILIVSDEDDIFGGNIVCGIGHLTSLFPEKLLSKDGGLRVDGMRCYWQHNSLIFKYGDKDCDAIHEVIMSIPENNESTIKVFPNPGKNELTINKNDFNNSDSTIKIFDINGRLIYEKVFSNDTEIINTTNWKSGIYLIKIGCENVKWLKE